LRDKKYFLFLHEILIDKIEYKNIEKKAELQQKQIVLSFSICDKMVDVAVFTTVESLQNRLNSSSNTGHTAFVPTMGALHNGHLDLVRRALEKSSQVVVSIFVNPTQFNSKADLDKYPRTLERDIQLLMSVGEVIVFAPTVEEMYPQDFKEINLNLGELETVMEGQFRPGHFNGVVNVVNRLFQIVQPKYAFFGEKDFQQLAVINRMVELLDLSIEIIPCPTVREPNGLAKSSRNERLSDNEKNDALILIQTMNYVKENLLNFTPNELKIRGEEYFNSGRLELEYLEIVDSKSLQSIENWNKDARICVAAYCGEVRLIDNMALNQ
jgi:pantoate--beta-alanine ligase